MRNVNRKVFLLVILVFLLSSVNSAVALLRHDGFMGIKWGTDIRRFPGVDWNHWDFEWKMYVESYLKFPMSEERLKSLHKLNDVKRLDEFPVVLIMYHFLDLRFSGVDILFAKDAWIEPQAYVNYLEDNFGKPTYYDDLNSTGFWQFDDGFVAIAEFNPPMRNAHMVLHLYSPQEDRYIRNAK